MMDHHEVELKTFSVKRYTSDFSIYLNRLVVRYTGSPIQDFPKPARLFSVLTHILKENVRSKYVLYFLWMYSEEYLGYYRQHQPGLLRQALKIVSIMKHDDIRFNDYNMLRFIEIIESRMELKETDIYRVPVESDFEETMKFLYTFILEFKRNHDLPITADRLRPNYY